MTTIRSLLLVAALGLGASLKGSDAAVKAREIKKEPIAFTSGDSDFKLSLKLRMPDFFYGKNLRLLNNNNGGLDKVVFARHTVDVNTDYRYGKASRGHDAVTAKMTIRNKGTWGDPESIGATTETEIKITDALTGAHRHAIPRHFLWIRELWLQMVLNDMANCYSDLCHVQSLTIGAFPFELGRGIALGASYAVDPTDLGFYAENYVDQYAFGAKLSGDISHRTHLNYDLYVGILNNKSDTFENVNAKIRGQQYGHRDHQARGFGVVNFVVAGRLMWKPIECKDRLVRIEPYVLYNDNPEQKIEFLGDSRSKLGTFGLAGEFEWACFEWGFDSALNIGHQTVPGWDRNTISLENRAGSVAVVNTRVRQALTAPTNSSPLALKTTDNQAIIDVSVQSESLNGQVIGSDALGILRNDNNRFSSPYTNKYKGGMIVADMSYYFIKPDLKTSLAFGYASGDENPNRDLEEIGDSNMDGDYKGFIGLQETYAGTRVKSAFLLSGSGRIPRLLSFPSEEVLDPFASAVSRFTNLIFTGASITYKPCRSKHNVMINPNILAYWQAHQTKSYNTHTAMDNLTYARRYLGTELNLFAELELLPDLKFYGTGALFIPGAFYHDVKGRPLNKAQQTYLDNLDKTGIINDYVPTLGDDLAYFINFGFEFKF